MSEEAIHAKSSGIAKTVMLKIKIAIPETENPREKTKIIWKETMRCKSLADGKQIDVAQYFKYLGSMKSLDGNLSRHYKSLIGMAREGSSKELKKKLL